MSKKVSCRTSLCLLGLFAAITLGADAHAQSPSRPEQAVAYVLSKRTLAMQYDHMNVRIDLAVPAIAVNIPEGYFRFVGTSGMMHFNGPNYAIPAPVPVSAEHAARITEFFAELNAGFPNTVFTEGEHPGQIVPDYYLGSHGSVGWYGVHLPFTWAQGYRVYLQVGGNGTPGAVAVFDSAGQPLRYGKLINTSRQSLTFSDVGIPFPPDVYSTERPTVRPPSYVPEHLRRGGARPYHEEITRMRLVYDHEVSNGRRLSGGSIKGLSIDHLACPQAPKVTRLPGTLVWTLSEDPAEQQRLLDAAAMCPVKFQMTMTASHIAAAGQKTPLRDLDRAGHLRVAARDPLVEGHRGVQERPRGGGRALEGRVGPPARQRSHLHRGAVRRRGRASLPAGDDQGGQRRAAHGGRTSAHLHLDRVLSWLEHAGPVA